MKTKISKTVKIVGLIFVLIIVGLYFLGRSSGGSKVSSGTINVKTGNDNINKVLSMGDTLTTLFVDYRDVQLETNALLLIDPTKTTPEQYAAFGAKVVEDWQKVDDDTFGLTGQENSFLNIFGASPAFAAGESNPPVFNLPFKASDFQTIDLSSHSSGNSEVNIVPSKWDNVNAIQAAVPKASTLSTVQNVFSTTAKEAQKIVEGHYTGEAKNFNNIAEFWKKAATTAVAVNTASKVGLFIGGAIVTAGGSAVLTGPASVAIGTGFGSSVGVVGGTVIVANGVGVVLDVGKNSATLGFASEETAAIYAKASETYQPVSDILAIAGLKSGMEDPGNLYSIYDFGSRGYDYLNLNFEGNKTININTGNGPPQFVALTAEGLFQSALPSGFQYIALPAQPTQKVADNSNQAVSGPGVLPKETFTAGMGSWYEEVWFKKQSSNGEVTFGGGGATFKGVGNSRSGIMLDLNKDVSDFQNLVLAATIEVDNQELSGTGWQGREAPVAVAVSYVDVNGNDHNLLDINEGGPNQMFWRGFYYLAPNDDQAQTTRGIKVSKGVPFRYNFDLMNLDPKPKTINFVAIEGAGWGGRSAKVSEISITGK